MMPLIEGGEIIERLGDRILGRVVLEDIVDPYTGEVLCPANAEITEDHVKIIDNAGIDRVKIRSRARVRDPPRHLLAVLRPRSRSRPHGQHRRSGRRDRGAVDRRAGNAADDAYVPHRRRRSDSHRAVARSRRATKAPSGSTTSSWSSSKDHSVVMNRQGEIVARRRDRPRARALRPAVRRAPDGRRTASASRAVSCWPSGIRSRCRSSTEVSGYVKYGDIVDGVTMQESLDEVTGLSRKTIIESKDADSRPRITLKDADGNTVKLPPAERSARRATSCRSARTSSSTTATTSRPATSSRRSRARRRRRRTSPAVCRASPSCSRRASRRITP